MCALYMNHNAYNYNVLHRYKYKKRCILTTMHVTMFCIYLQMYECARSAGLANHCYECVRSHVYCTNVYLRSAGLTIHYYECVRSAGLAIHCYECVRSAGLAIHCYECNSRYDRSCGDEFTRKGVGIIDCDVKLKGEHLQGQNSTVCRKIVHYGEQARIQGVGAGARAHPWDGVSPFKMHYSVACKNQSITGGPLLGEVLYPPRARADTGRKSRRARAICFYWPFVLSNTHPGAPPRNFRWGDEFMGTHTHLPPKVSFSSDFGNFFENVGKCKILIRVNKQQKQSCWNILISSGTSPADFSTGRDASHRPPSPRFRRPCTHQCHINEHLCLYLYHGK